MLQREVNFSLSSLLLILSILFLYWVAVSRASKKICEKILLLLLCAAVNNLFSNSYNLEESTVIPYYGLTEVFVIQEVFASLLCARL